MTISLFDNRLVEGDHDANEAADEDARRPTVQGRIDSRDVLEVYEAPERVILLVNNIREQRLDDIERQGIKRVVEVSRVASATSRLASQVEEIRHKQRNNQARESPQCRRTPE